MVLCWSASCYYNQIPGITYKEKKVYPVWHTPVIWRLRWGDCKFKACPDHIERHHLKIKKYKELGI